MYFPRRSATGIVVLAACLHGGQVARASRPDSGLQTSLALDSAGRQLAQPAGRATGGASGSWAKQMGTCVLLCESCCIVLACVTCLGDWALLVPMLVWGQLSGQRWDCMEATLGHCWDKFQRLKGQLRDTFGQSRSNIDLPCIFGASAYICEGGFFDSKFDTPKLRSYFEWKLQCDTRLAYGGCRCKVLCSTPGGLPSYVMVHYLGNYYSYGDEARRKMTGKSAYVLSTIPLEDHKEFQLSEGNRHLLTDFFSEGNLTSQVDHLTEQQTAVYFWQLVRGMQDMHDQDLVHTDVNLENVLVHCEELSCYAALVGLHYACQTGNKSITRTSSDVQKHFSAPEDALAKGGKPCFPSYDVWSMGALLHYLFFRKYPDKKEPQLKAVVEAYEKETKTDINAEVIQKVQAILTNALAPDPEQRTTGPQLLEEAQQLLELADSEKARMIVGKVPTDYGARKPAPKCLNVWPEGPHCGTGTLGKFTLAEKANGLAYQYERRPYSWTGEGCYRNGGDKCVQCSCDDTKTETHFQFLLKSC